MASDKPHILIVDHEAAPDRSLARMLAAEYRVQRAPDAPHVLDVVRSAECKPDLILLDVRPPIREGFDICRQIKADEMARSVPVMLITQHDHAEDEVRGLGLGAADCITRPFRLDVVRARIRNQIRLKINNDLLERYANQDGLTDVANRRCFDLALEVEWRRAMRDGKPLSLLMVDVDRFKQYNDRYGHFEGDQCLRQVAGAMAQALTRPGDLLARYGGEEFSVILPGADLEGARRMGERLRLAVAEMSFPQLRQNHVQSVSISVGCVSGCPNPNQTFHQLLQAADEQLYAAKGAGRNCVCAKQMAANLG